MGLVKFKKSNTPSQRQVVLVKKSHLNKTGGSLRYKTKGLQNLGGRNNYGRITVRHQGGGVKQKYRKIDFKRQFCRLAIVLNIEYDPNRSAFIAKLYRLDIKTAIKKYLYFYIIAPKDLKVGDFLSSLAFTDLNIGNALKLGNVTLGALIYNIPLIPGSKGVLARSAGTYGQVMKKMDNDFTAIRLPSGELRKISNSCFVSIGITSNLDHKSVNLGKAGRSRWLNKRPTVRGVAMNPVDHPHGGGEGKTSGGRPSVSPWGRLTKGQPTRKKYKKNKMILEKCKASK